MKNPLKWLSLLIATALTVFIMSCADDFPHDVIDIKNKSSNHDTNDDHGSDRLGTEHDEGN